MGADHLNRHTDAHFADGVDLEDRSHGDDRRRSDRIPDDARNRGPVRDELLLPGFARTVYGGERNSYSPQPAHASRCPGTRSSCLVCVPDGIDQSLRLTIRRSVCVPPLADVGGTERLTEFLSLQRDLYGYLHDQTLRRINQGGWTGLEIAESIELPTALAQAWHTHVLRFRQSQRQSHLPAIHGWFDGNPAHLWEHPPVESAKRHVEFMGGSAEVLRKARESYERGDFRWVAQVVNYVVFAEPDNVEAKNLQADTFEQLGYGAENGTWRNFYLTGAYELRNGSVGGTPTVAAAPDITAALSVSQVFDAVSLRVDGVRAAGSHIVVDWNITDENIVHRTELSNGVLIHFDVEGGSADAGSVDAMFSLSRRDLLGVLLGGVDLGAEIANGTISVSGDAAKLAELAGYLDEPDPNFAIVTPT